MKAICFIIIACALITSAHAQESQPYIENELIIWLEQGVDAAEFAAVSYMNIVPKRLLSKRLNIWLFEFTDKPAQRSTGERIRRVNSLSNNTYIKHIQNNYTGIANRSTVPNDTYYADQWGHDTIKLPEVWDEFTTGGNTADGDEIVIAVVDDGIDLRHEDFNLWKNINEIPGNGIDDDNNGYPDDYNGWNANINSGSIPLGEHGTNVAGVAGAVSNNGKGISGVNWNVKIMPVVGTIPFNNTSAAVIAAYSYILEMRTLYNETNGEKGAFIVATNSSFGVDQGNRDPAIFPVWCAMYDTLGYAGVLSCSAVPDFDENTDQIHDTPTSCSSDFLITVTATTKNDSKRQGAAYGVNTVDIGAPGEDIYTTYSCPHDWEPLCGGEYVSISGTSMASPYVAGVIGLMYASMPQSTIQAYKCHPAEMALQVKQCLLDAADRVPALNGLVASGRLNAYAAIQNIQALCPTIITDQTISTTRTINSCCDIEISNTTIEPGANVTVTSSTQIRLLPGFHAKEGSRFHAKIESCESTSGSAPSLVRERNMFDSQDINTVTVPEEAPKPANIISSEIEIYPNPASSTVTITAGNSAKINRIKISNSLGITVLSVNTDNTSSADIDISALSKGIYFVSVFTENDKLHSSKLIKE